MRQEAIEKIVGVCIAANPEIVSPKIVEGGYAKLRSENKPRLVLRVAPMFTRTEVMVQLQGFGGEFNEDLLEPAARPIRLADCVQAYARTARLKATGGVDRLAIPTREQAAEARAVWADMCIRWDCLKDDLTEQSDENLEFIASIL